MIAFYTPSSIWLSVICCASEGIFHNRPAMKFDDQFDQVDIAENFDIASLRIHVERYIGGVRDWSILNRV